jgi:hypothetical protein
MEKISPILKIPRKDSIEKITTLFLPLKKIILSKNERIKEEIKSTSSEI